MNTQEKATELAQKLIEAEIKSLALKEINKEINALKADLNEAMDDEGIPSITVKVGGGEVKFDPIQEEDYKLIGNFSGQKWDECGVFFNWLGEIGEDGLIKTKPSVHAQTRKSFLAKWEESGEPLPDFIGKTYFSTIKFNKSLVTRLAKGEGA